MTRSYSHTLLLVDDEPSILNSLKRLFRRQGFDILSAESGQAALEILDRDPEAVSLIISDQRMPGMSGSEFLEQAARLAPEAMRFTLTGHADINAVIDAVNKGKIHRYMTKPWKDQEILDQVNAALDQVELRLENQRLKELTQRQNQELSDLNKDLEKKVNERTWALQIQMKQLKSVNRSLNQGLMETVRLLLALASSSNPRLGTYMTETAQLARTLAKAAGMDDAGQDLVEMAGLVHDIGLLGMPESIIEKDTRMMTNEELETYRRHPLIAAVSLSAVERLQPVADLVRAHHEYVDGSGFPDRLTGDQIPLGARILAVAAGFQTIVHLWPENIQRLLANARRYLDATTVKTMDISDPDLREVVAERIVSLGAGTRYDLGVMRLLMRQTAHLRASQDVINLPVQALKEGMVLMQDLRLGDGRLLLGKGSVLNARSIQSLQGIGDRDMIGGTIEIAAPNLSDTPVGENRS